MKQLLLTLGPAVGKFGHAVSISFHLVSYFIGLLFCLVTAGVLIAGLVSGVFLIIKNMMP